MHEHMKITIRKRVRTEQEIDLELPYFFRCDVGHENYESVVFGRVDEARATMITITCHRGARCAEIEIFDGPPGDAISGYVDDEYLCDEAAYEAAKSRARDLMLLI